MSNPRTPPPPSLPVAAPRPRQELSLPGLLLGATLTVGAFTALAAALAAVPLEHKAIPGYTSWLSAVPQEAVARLQWVLGDITEPQFYKSWIASIGLVLGATFAWWALRRRSCWAGRPIAYGSGLWPWMLTAASLSLVLSNTAFGPNVDTGWQPTFVPFVSVATSVVLVYGAGWAKALTGAFLGAFTTPLAMVLIQHVTSPLALPSVVANTSAMTIGAAITFLFCRALPWMTLHIPQLESQEQVLPVVRRRPTLLSDTTWTVRRILTDFTETQFYANEWASLGLIAGAVLTTALNPSFASYGTGLLPRILVAQALTSAIGIIVWRRLYRGDGWAPTYVSVVSVAPATVLTYGNSVAALILGAVGGALLCPVVARTVYRALPADFHPFIGNTVAMAVVTALIVPAVGLVG